MAGVIGLGVIDDDRMLLDGLASWLSGAPDLRLDVAARTVDELLAALRPGGVASQRSSAEGASNAVGIVASQRSSAEGASDAVGTIEVVVLDLVLRDGSSPADNVTRLVAAGLRVLVISVWLNLAEVAATFAAGASGYLTKDHDLAALAAAARTVADGGTVYSPELAVACLRDPRPERPHLSAREREVLLAYASGMTLHGAARHVGIRPETAKTYLDRVKAKYQALGRPTRTKDELATRVREDGLHPPLAHDHPP